MEMSEGSSSVFCDDNRLRVFWVPLGQLWSYLVLDQAQLPSVLVPARVSIHADKVHPLHLLLTNTKLLFHSKTTKENLYINLTMSWFSRTQKTIPMNINLFSKEYYQMLLLISLWTCSILLLRNKINVIEKAATK